ncbi:MAG TPA: hypothetical protein VG820_06880 [Fimbriimonadaceae bacterium]|nr:hypothetical protein [Fimbriimonadaceae bacterium]
MKKLLILLIVAVVAAAGFVSSARWPTSSVIHVLADSEAPL